MPVRSPGLRHARRTTAAALAALAMSATGLITTATPAVAAEPAPLSIVVSPARQTRASGASASLLFTMTSNGKRIAGKQIAIYIRPTTSTTWIRHWAPTTNAYGQTRVTWAVSRSLYVKAKFAGSTAYARTTSNTAYVGLQQAFGTRVINEAATHRGKPYLWGATGPSRFDCSGFTLYVFRQLGKSLPRTSRDQYAALRKVARSEKRIGDLIFTYSSSGRIYHVGIYAGNGEIWHSPKSGDVVKRSAIWSPSYYVGRVA